MRYIGRSSTTTLVQIDPDRNSFVNIKSFGAAGLDQYFEGRVRGVSGDGTIISVGDIPNYSGYERNYFKPGQELYCFFYEDTSTPNITEYEGIFTNLNIEAVGAIVQSGALEARTLQYYVYAFNPKLGRFSPYRKTFSLANVYKDPLTQFDADNFARLSFNRFTSDWIPVIFRQWGSQSVRFVGIPSNNIFGRNTLVTFNDRGQTEIPTWDEKVMNDGGFTPEFFEGIVNATNDGVVAKTMIVKRRLKIVTRSISGVLECVDAELIPASFSNLDNTSIKVKIKFDDTKPVQDAIDFAASNNLKDVFIPSGTYSIRNINLYGSIPASGYSGIVLRGSGEGSILKKMATAVNPLGQYGMIGMLGSGVSNRINGITVSSLSFDGNKTETFPLNVPENDVYGLADKYNDSLALEFVDSVRIMNCSFYNGAGAAMYSLDSDKITFTNNRISALSKPFEINIPPIKIRESSRIIAQGNLFENCSGAIDLTGIDASVINNNIINSCGETGLQLNASDSWNAQGNLTLNESGSLIRTVDLYQNDYSRVSLDIKRGQVMSPTYFTVTDGGFPVSISPGSITARVYPLTSFYTINTTSSQSFLQVLESKPQLEAGIFAITAPVSSITGAGGGSNQSRAIRGTSAYELINTAAGRYGYGYKITATVSLGRYPVDRIVYASSTAIKIFLRNSSDLLSLLFFAAGDASNDKIATSGIGIPNTGLSTWPDNLPLSVQSVDTTNAAIVLTTPTEVAEEFTSPSNSYSTPTGYLSLVKGNYFIADGNIYVSD
jgi:hypothetical protein